MVGHRRRTALGIAFCTLLLLVDFGCTGSDELVSESGSLTLEVVMSPADSGRYESSILNLNQMTVRPTDPVANTTLGSVPFGMLTGPVSLSLQDPSALTTAPISLSDGEYSLESVIFDNPTLFDFDPIVPPVTCLDGVLAAPRTQGKLPPPEVNAQVVQAKIRLGPFSPPIVFSVPRLGNKTLRMLIDGPALTAMFEQAFTCRTTGLCGSASAPCMSAFTPLTPDQAATAFRFE